MEENEDKVLTIFTIYNKIMVNISNNVKRGEKL